jgi:uncharacterized protein (TIGR03067 family)
LVAVLSAGCGKNDKDKIQGTWTASSMEVGGEKAPDEALKSAPTFTFAGTR